MKIVILDGYTENPGDGEQFGEYGDFGGDIERFVGEGGCGNADAFGREYV